MQNSFDPKLKLLEVAKERGALLFGEFELSAGGTSSYYFDGRLLTLDPEGSYLTAKCFIPTLLDCGVEVKNVADVDMIFAVFLPPTMKAIFQLYLISILPFMTLSGKETVFFESAFQLNY